MITDAENNEALGAEGVASVATLFTDSAMAAAGVAAKSAIGDPTGFGWLY